MIPGNPIVPGDPLHGEGPGGPLWGVLDCARDPGLIDEVNRHPAEKQCLFDQSPAAVTAAAPWLVRLGEGTRLLERWRDEGLADHWGALFRSEQPLHELRRELRKRLLVTLPDGRRAVFRFYDPRVAADVEVAPSRL